MSAVNRALEMLNLLMEIYRRIHTNNVVEGIQTQNIIIHQFSARIWFELIKIWFCLPMTDSLPFRRLKSEVSNDYRQEKCKYCYNYSDRKKAKFIEIITGSGWTLLEKKNRKNVPNCNARAYIQHQMSRRSSTTN